MNEQIKGDSWAEKSNKENMTPINYGIINNFNIVTNNIEPSPRLKKMLPWLEIIGLITGGFELAKFLFTCL